MRKGIKRLTIGFGAVLTTLLVGCIGIVITWGLVGAPENDTVAPHTVIADIDISDMNQEQLDSALDGLGARFTNEPLLIDVEGESPQLSIRPEEIELRLDQEATANKAMQIGRQGSLPEKVWRWLQSFVLNRETTPVVAFDRQKLIKAVESEDPGPKNPATEPSLRLKDGEMHFDEGKKGQGINPRSVADNIPAAAAKGLPLRVETKRGDIPPLFDAQDLEETFEDYRDGYQEIPVKSAQQTEELDFAKVQPWLRAQVSREQLRIAADAKETQPDLEKLMSDAGIRVKQASYIVNNETPVFQPGTNGTECCEPRAGELVANALSAQPEAIPTQIDLGVRTVEPEIVPGEEGRLGVTKKIATFTTNHEAGQPRVQNIHRIADMTKGTLILPGQVFSLNGAVGPRTTQKGFVEDGVILNGKFEKSVGGGISQYSTTLFNAAFFAGLEWTEYQSHSIYINRYPFGREATISYPAPDQKIKNITPYGVVIWATYTDTSITVDLYSSDYATGEQTNQTQTPRGECTSVKTERTRRFVDGRETKDHVYALYQPEEGVLC